MKDLFYLFTADSLEISISYLKIASEIWFQIYEACKKICQKLSDAELYKMFVVDAFMFNLHKRDIFTNKLTPRALS